MITSYKQRALQIYASGVKSPTKIAKSVIKEGFTKDDLRLVRQNISNWIKNFSPESFVARVSDKPFVLSAWNDDGYMMDIDQYCEHYMLPRKDIKKYKLVSHTGTPFYNIEFKDNEIKSNRPFDIYRCACRHGC